MTPKPPLPDPHDCVYGMAWIKRRIGMADNATIYDVFGQMHVLIHAKYMWDEFVRLGKCNKKDHIIAMQWERIHALEEEVKRGDGSVYLQVCRHGMDRYTRCEECAAVWKLAREDAEPRQPCQ